MTAPTAFAFGYISGIAVLAVTAALLGRRQRLRAARAAVQEAARPLDIPTPLDPRWAPTVAVCTEHKECIEGTWLAAGDAVILNSPICFGLFVRGMNLTDAAGAQIYAELVYAAWRHRAARASAN